MNTSKRKSWLVKKAVNSSYFRIHSKSLNNSIFKETLKSNNRSLAKALEEAKAELHKTENALLESLQDGQANKVELAKLKRVVGLKNEEIEREVKRRVCERMHQIEDALHKISVNVMATSDSLAETMQVCQEYVEEAEQEEAAAEQGFLEDDDIDAPENMPQEHGAALEAIEESLDDDQLVEELEENIQPVSRQHRRRLSDRPIDSRFAPHKNNGVDIPVPEYTPTNSPVAAAAILEERQPLVESTVNVAQSPKARKETDKKGQRKSVHEAAHRSKGVRFTEQPIPEDVDKTILVNETMDICDSLDLARSTVHDTLGLDEAPASRTPVREKSAKSHTSVREKSAKSRTPVRKAAADDHEVS